MLLLYFIKRGKRVIDVKLKAIVSANKKGRRQHLSYVRYTGKIAENVERPKNINKEQII